MDESGFKRLQKNVQIRVDLNQRRTYFSALQSKHDLVSLRHSSFHPKHQHNFQ